jgi:exopolyphosphatase/guanosine-5'-triphosphate,3'-diphosphate pyrophosphatase
MVNTVPVAKIPASGLDQDRFLAAIDMGTNSLHMVIVRVEPKLPAFSIISKEKETVRLGDRDPKTGNLKPEVIERAKATLHRFKEIAKVHNVEQIIAVATSAVREAPNGRDFLAEVEDELDLSVSLISGQEEARRIYLGVLSGMELNGQPHIMIDIGGGSTELILGDGHEPRSLSSSKVGAVRLTAEFITTDPISSNEFQYLQAFIRGTLERPVDELRSKLKPGEQPRLVGTSGTIETLVAIHAREKLGTEPTRLSGYQLPLKDLANFINRLRKLSYSERLSIPGMSDRRAEIILAGAMILHEAMSMLGMDSITICERALREGVIVDWMLTHGLIEDRLRYQSSIRQRSTLKIAQKYRVHLESGERVAAFALSIFDQTLGSLHNWQTEARELLWSAGILHNCGIHINHSSHHKHSYYLIRHSELLGFTEAEIEVVANLARYHRKSTPKKKHDSYRSLSKRYRQMVSQLSPILRLATALDRRQIGAVRQLRCEYNAVNKELHLILIPAMPNDECVLERWSLQQKKEAFEAEFGVKIVTRLERVPIPIA